MPKVFFTGSESAEQAVGATLYNGRMKMYAVRRDNPLDMVFLGGHRISDALTYNITEAVIVPEYVCEDGENTVLEVYVSDDKVKGINFNLELPNKSIPAATRIMQTQKECTWDLLFVPQDCGDGCDTFFWLGRNLRLGSFQITNAIVGFDDTKAPINRISVARLTGQLLQYNGLTTKTLTPAATALFDVVIGDELCLGCTCPYQTMYRAGTAGLVEETTDGGLNWTALDTTAIINGTEITNLAVSNGRLIAGHSDVNDATGLTGGVAYNVNGVFVESTILDLAGAAITPAIQSVVSTGGSLVYAFGNDAVGNAIIIKSCDSGLSFVEVGQTVITATILSADYDSKTGNMWIGTAGNGGVFAWDFTSFEDETLNLNGGLGVGAVDILSIEVTGEDNVAFGTSDGQFWENFDFQNGGDWRQTEALANAIYASAGDFYNYRTLIGSGTDTLLRDGYNFQISESILTSVGNITAISEGKTLLDEGTNFAVAVTDIGETFLITQCNICFETC